MAAGEQHASASLVPVDTWNIGIQRGDVLTGNKSEDEIAGFPGVTDTIKNAIHGNYPTAMVLTSFGASVCLVARAENEFWLFDSHGNPAYVERFGNLKEAIDGVFQGRLKADEETFKEGLNAIKNENFQNPNLAAVQFDLVPFKN